MAALADQSAYFDRCERTDWYFANCDDYAKFRAGESAMSTLAMIATMDSDFRAIFDAFNAYHTTGAAFGTPRSPMPVRPTGQLTLI